MPHRRASEQERRKGKQTSLCQLESQDLNRLWVAGAIYERNLKTTSGTDTWQAGWFVLALLSTLKDLLCEWFFGALNMVRGINDYPPPLHFQSSALREGVCLVGSGEEGGREEAGAREQWACCGGELSLSPCTHTAALIPQSLTPTLSGNRCVSGNLCLRHSKSHSLSLSYCIYCLLCMATGTTFNMVLNQLDQPGPRVPRISCILQV